MKSKKSRILGVALSLALLASLFGFAAPVAAQPGDQNWAAQTIPTATGNVLLNASDVADIAVADDGTIYAINNGPAATAAVAGTVLKSTNGGQSFTALTAVGGAVARFLRAVAVAPDNSNIVLVTDGFDCYLSTDSGTTWTTLGTDIVTSTGDANAEIQDVDVSPAISGALFGRHYVRASANVTAGILGVQPVELIGVQQTDWTAITTAANGDALAVKFSPSYVGDRALSMVYNTGAATFFDIISQPQAAGENRTQTCNMALGPQRLTTRAKTL
jgi:hypothetical protein